MNTTLQNNKIEVKTSLINLSLDNANDNSEVMKMDIRFCELLCAKFCHDMAGPVGAINNGIDFIASEDPEMKAVAMDLLSTSSKKAINNLVFLRQAYGFAPYESDVNFYTLKTFIENFLKETRIEVVVLKEIKNEIINSRVAKLLYNLTMMLSSIMMYLGHLKILLGEDSIIVTSKASVHKIDEDLEQILQGKQDSSGLTARNVQVAFTSLIALDLGYKTTMECSSPDTLTLTLKKIR
jgi:histidine phosphotransferase ChpT